MTSHETGFLYSVTLLMLIFKFDDQKLILQTEQNRFLTATFNPEAIFIISVGKPNTKKIDKQNPVNQPSRQTSIANSRKKSCLLESIPTKSKEPARSTNIDRQFPQKILLRKNQAHRVQGATPDLKSRSSQRSPLVGLGRGDGVQGRGKTLARNPRTSVKPEYV